MFKPSVHHIRQIDFMEVVQNAGFNTMIMALKGKQLKTLQSTCLPYALSLWRHSCHVK